MTIGALLLRAHDEAVPRVVGEPRVSRLRLWGGYLDDAARVDLGEQHQGEWQLQLGEPAGLLELENRNFHPEVALDVNAQEGVQPVEGGGGSVGVARRVGFLNPLATRV